MFNTLWKINNRIGSEIRRSEERRVGKECIYPSISLACLYCGNVVNYKRNYFWIKRDLKGNKHYYFKIKGQYHEVSEEVYKTCYNSFKKEEREKEKRSEFKVSSLDQLDNNNTALVDKIADNNNQYDTFNVNEEVENVMNIINQLSEEDKNLITNLLIKNKTERELSALMGVSQPAIHKRKKRIIENIKNKSKK